MVAEQEGRLDQRSSLVGRRSQRRGLAGQVQIALLYLLRVSASKDRIRGVSFVFIVEKKYPATVGESADRAGRREEGNRRWRVDIEIYEKTQDWRPPLCRQRRQVDRER